MAVLRASAAAVAFALLIDAALTAGCAARAPAVVAVAAPVTAAPAPVVASGGVDAKLAEVARIHGGSGPWAVAGYRMGEYALAVLGVPRGSFDLDVVHYTPREVQYSCIADGAAAATGASLGKLNLSLVDAAPEATHTVYRQRSSGRSIELRVSRSFAARYRDVPREQLAAAGREAMQLPDADVFEVMTASR